MPRARTLGQCEQSAAVLQPLGEQQYDSHILTLDHVVEVIQDADRGLVADAHQVGAAGAAVLKMAGNGPADRAALAEDRDRCMAELGALGRRSEGEHHPAADRPHAFTVGTDQGHRLPIADLAQPLGERASTVEFLEA